MAHPVKGNQPLMANARDIHDAVAQVSSCLTHTLGGLWKPSKDAVDLIDKIASSESNRSVSKFLESAPLNALWVAEAA